MSNKAYLTWALNQEGNLVHVDEVPNGNDCGCVCPHCKSRLCAKNGGDEKIMIHHFAHLSGADCVGAVESALHKMAKDILLETKCVYLPDRFDGRKGSLHHFDRVEVEFYDKDTRLRPDSIGYNGDDNLWVEFKRTHAVDTKKKGKIISAHIDCIEIDLNGCPLDPIAVKEFLINSSERRMWIRDASSKKRMSGHASRGTYCNRYDDFDDYYYGYRSVVRTYAKDENGQLVSLQDDHYDMNEHSYFCLACGKELTIDVCDDGTYCFVHVEDNDHCKDDLYLHEAAKEIVFDKFCHSDEFIIDVPQFQECVEKNTCMLFCEDECYKEKTFPFNIKEHGFVECYKDYLSPSNNDKWDLVFMRTDSLTEAITVSIDKSVYHESVTPMNSRHIEIIVCNEKSLDALRNNHLGKSNSKFIHFKRNNRTGIPPKVMRKLYKFELFTTGKYYLRKVSCNKTNDRKSSTTFELIFPQSKIDRTVAKTLALLRCYQLKKKSCYCEICFFLKEVNSYGISERICMRYKTKSTPHFPMKEMPLNCPHFSLDKGLIGVINREHANMKTIETDIL